MKIFCVTGAADTDLQTVAGILAAGGMQPARPSQQHDALTLGSWHEQVLEAEGDKPVLAPVAQHPGKFWEQVASNLFLENMGAPLWGWADSRSVWLLDFWKQFEPNLHFVLVYSSPERALASALSSGVERGTDIATLMTSWEAHHQEMLRFHNRNPGRTMLVDVADCLANPSALIAACAEKWNLKLALADTSTTPPPRAEPLVSYLAAQLLRSSPQIKALQNEVEASFAPLRSDTEAPVATVGGMDLDGAVQECRTLLETARQVKPLVNRCAELKLELDNRDAEIACRTSQETDMQAEITALKTSGSLLKSENGQLLMQLHLVQEELEAGFLSSKKSQEEKRQKDADIAALKAQFATQSTAIAAQAADRAAATTTLKAELAAAVLAHNTEVARLKTQHAADLKKVENTAAKLAATQELTTVKQQCSRLEQEKREQNDKLGKQQEMLTKTGKELELAVRARKDAQQEGELLLVQLHQVQEELERYFLQHKAAVTKNEELDARWMRMLQRNPEYCHYQALAVTNVDVPAMRVSWMISDLHAAGRSLPAVRFDTVVENGVLGFVFARNGVAKDGMPLLQWPQSAPQNQDEIAIGAVPESGVILNELGTSDWALLKTLCKLVSEALNNAETLPDASVRQIPVHDRTGLSDASDRLMEILGNMPPVVRYDQLSLLREQINPDYEHLWLRIQNISLGQERWSAFEFRLSCANVRPNKFGAYPKLEFPEGVCAPFDSWFVESYDDFGEKLEVRFALPEAMDMGVWQALSEHDHEFLDSLINALPAMLRNLAHDGVKIARPWNDWIDLANNVQGVLTARTKPSALTISAAPAVTPINAPARDSAIANTTPSSAKKSQARQQARAAE